MADIRKPVSAIYQPKSISELISAMSKSPNAVLVAGGTDLLSREHYYPDCIGTDGIVTTGIAELTRVNHGDRYFEAGAAITISQLLTSGVYIFSKEVYQAIEKSTSSLIRNQATIGGSLFTKGVRFSLSCILSTIGAICELKILIRKGNGRVTTSTRWVPVSKLYNEDGSLTYPKDVVLTRIRIPAYDGSVQVFRTLGNLKESPDNAVVFGMQYGMTQTSFSAPTVCVVFPKGGFLFGAEIDNILNGVSLPVNTKRITDISAKLVQFVKRTCPDVSELQLERLKRLFETILYNANAKFLAG